MPDRPSADRTAEVLFWYYRRPSRYQAEGRRRDAPPVDPEVVLKLALAAPGRVRRRGVEGAAKDSGAPAGRGGLCPAHVLSPGRNARIRRWASNPVRSPEEIKESFRLLMQLVHPDRQGAPENMAGRLRRTGQLGLRSPSGPGHATDLRGGGRGSRGTCARDQSGGDGGRGVADAGRRFGRTPPPKGRRAIARAALPEWLTAGVGGYVRQHPATTAFGVLIAGRAGYRWHRDVGGARRYADSRCARDAPACRPLVNAVAGRSATAARRWRARTRAPARRANPDAGKPMRRWPSIAPAMRDGAWRPRRMSRPADPVGVGQRPRGAVPVPVPAPCRVPAPAACRCWRRRRRRRALVRAAPRAGLAAKPGAGAGSSAGQDPSHHPRWNPPASQTPVSGTRRRGDVAARERRNRGAVRDVRRHATSVGASMRLPRSSTTTPTPISGAAARRSAANTTSSFACRNGGGCN